MKMTQHVAKTIIAGLLASSILVAPVHAQTGQRMPMTDKTDKSSSGTMDPGSKMDPGSTLGGSTPGTGGMMQMREKMQAEMKMMDDELDALVIKMNHASGSGKIDAMAAVITKMAQQRKKMDQKMAAMQSSMMQGMMGSGMKQSPMKQSPMMPLPLGK